MWMWICLSILFVCFCVVAYFLDCEIKKRKLAERISNSWEIKCAEESNKWMDRMESFERRTLESVVVNSDKYRELPNVDPHLYQQFLLGLVEGEHWGFLVDSYMHQFVDQCGSLAESGNVNAELLNSGKIQAIKGLYHHVMVQVNAIKAQQALEQHESVINE